MSVIKLPYNTDTEKEVFTDMITKTKTTASYAPYYRQGDYIRFYPNPTDMCGDEKNESRNFIGYVLEQVAHKITIRIWPYGKLSNQTADIETDLAHVIAYQTKKEIKRGGD